MLNKFKSYLNITSFCRIICIPNIIVFKQHKPLYRQIHSKSTSSLACLSLGNLSKKVILTLAMLLLQTMSVLRTKSYGCHWFQQESKEFIYRQN